MALIENSNPMNDKGGTEKTVFSLRLVVEICVLGLSSEKLTDFKYRIEIS